ncbi:MAG: glycosyltransferase family 4 protein [Phycisphaeraceae bacterium]|nr:glycosyltransferase family 4 protein [Phycisphaeraceae bacterium]
MRILTVIHNLGPGGMQRIAQECAIAFRESGHDSAVLAYEAGGPRIARLQAAGVSTFVGGTGLDQIRHVTAQASGWNPDIIHAHRFGGARPMLGVVLRQLKAKSAHRLPIVATKHFAQVDWTPDRNLLDVHVQISQWCMWRWRRWARPLSPPPVDALVRPFVRPDSFYPSSVEQREAFRARLGLAPDAFLLGRFGQPQRPIWPRTLLLAFEAFAKTEPRAHLLLLGRAPALDRAMADLRPDVRARVLSMPFLHDDQSLREAYSALDVFLHVTRIGETFGMVLCEAMLCGTPVVTLSTPTKSNAQLEIVGHERGGLVCADLASVPVALRRLMDDYGLRRRLGMQAREWVRAELEPKQQTEKLLRVFALAVEHEDRESLRRALAAEEAIVTKVTAADIERLCEHTIGRVSFWDRAVMRLVENPWAHRLIYTMMQRRQMAGPASQSTGTSRLFSIS